MEIEEAIVTRLTAQVPSLSGKIYPAADVPIKTMTPYCTYQRSSTDRTGTLYEQGSFGPSFEFNIYESTYSAMRALRKLVRLALEDATGYYSAGAPYIEQTEIVSELDGFDERVHFHSGILEIKLFYS